MEAGLDLRVRPALTPIALAAAAFTGGRVVYHEHDAPATPRPNWVIKRCLDARTRLLRAASIVVAPNADRAARLSATGWRTPGIHRLELSTAAHEQAAPDARTRWARASYSAARSTRSGCRSPSSRLSPGHESPVTLDVAGYETVGSRGYIAALAEHARSLGVEQRVRFLGTVSEDDWSVVFEQCDIGLALMPMASSDENMRHMAGASNKPFEYLSCGVAPLVSDLPDWRRTFVEPGYALVCNPSQVESIAAAFDWAADIVPRFARSRRVAGNGCASTGTTSRSSPRCSTQCGGDRRSARAGRATRPRRPECVS